MGLDAFALEPPPFALNRVLAKYVPIEVSNAGLRIGIQLASWTVRAARRGVDIARKVDFDLVYATNNNLFNLLTCLWIAKQLRLPCVAVVHHLRWVDYRDPFDRFQFGRLDASRFFRFLRDEGVSIPNSWARVGGGYVESKILPSFDGFIAISAPIASQLSSLVQTNRIFVVGNAPFNAKSGAQAVAEPETAALFVGRIDEGKGIGDLVKAWKLVVQQCPDAHLDIVGDGFLREQMVSDAGRRGLDKNLKFTGFLDDTEIVRLQSRSRFFVTLSRTEGFGMAIAEALAAGLPVVAWDTPPLREIFGDCPAVFLCNQGKIEEIVASSVNLLTIAQNDWHSLSNQASNYSRRFSWKNAALEEIRVLETVVKGFRSQR